MGFWPFQQKHRKQQCSVNLHQSVGRDLNLAAAWTVYGGMLALIWRREYVQDNPAGPKPDTPFGIECCARDAMAEFWQVKQRAGAAEAYLDVLAAVRAAGFLNEYVWRFLRRPNWEMPAGLTIEAFEKWLNEKGLQDHKPGTLAGISVG